MGDGVAAAFNSFKLHQGEYDLRYMTFKIEGKKTIVIDKKGGKDKSYEDFVEELPEDDSRYGLVDLDFETADGRATSKIVFISWNPDTAPVRTKMLYAGSKEALKSVCDGVGIQINATDNSELDLESCILPKVKSFA